MKNALMLPFALLLFASGLSAQQDKIPDARVEYIKKYKDAAKAEMDRAGVPASIKLGQAILESNAGQSLLAVEANNHFGLKCSSQWDGKTYYIEDDDKDENGAIIKSCFRKYKKVADCYEDHSDFLRDPRKYNRYGFLFQLDPQDYRSWAYGLQSAGYATADTYAESLIRVIENYRLYEYDKEPAGEIPPPISNRRGIGRVNDVKVILTKEGESMDDVSRIYRLKTEKLIEYNDRGYARSDKLPANTRIFIQKKAKKWHGRSKTHFVKDAQTMFEISQLYGVQLEKLLKRNKMEYGEEPANGEQVRLKGFFWQKGPKPKLRSVDERDNMERPDGDSPTPPTKADPRPVEDPKMTTDEGELFEIENGAVKDDQTKPGTNKPGNTGRPSTTGTPIPSTPPSGTTTRPSDGKPTTTLPPPVNRPSKPTGPGTYHTVIKGDTLYNISKRYNTTVAKIRQLNNMVDDNIKIGQDLRVN